MTKCVFVRLDFSQDATLKARPRDSHRASIHGRKKLQSEWRGNDVQHQIKSLPLRGFVIDNGFLIFECMVPGWKNRKRVESGNSKAGGRSRKRD